MPTNKREGHTAVTLEFPDELLAAVRAAAESGGLKVAPWVFTACAAAAGVEYTPPKLGRPAAEPPPKKRGRPGRAAPPAPKRRRGGG